MTHRGPFQPLPFCDSVTKEHGEAGSEYSTTLLDRVAMTRGCKHPRKAEVKYLDRSSLSIFLQIFQICLNGGGGKKPL